DAQRLANRRRGPVAHFEPGRHHPAARHGGRATERFVEQGGEDAAMHNAGKALEARIGRELGDDGVALLAEDQPQSIGVAHAAGKPALVAAAVVQAIRLRRSLGWLVLAGCYLICHISSSSLHAYASGCLSCGYSSMVPLPPSSARAATFAS